MNSSEEKRLSEENKPTSFNDLRGRARQPRRKCSGQNYSGHPLAVPWAGFRNGNLYFPWSLVPRKYLDFLPPQSSLPTTPNQRPNFWYYSGHEEKMKTKGPQTNLKQLWHNKVSQSSCESKSVVYNPHGGEDPSLEKMCEEEGEMDSYPQGHMPSAAPLAHSNNPHGGENPSLEKMCEEEGEMDSYPQGHMPSAAPLAHSNKVNVAIQCDMRWLEDAELERSPASSPGGRKGTGEESVLCGILGTKEVGEQDSRPSTAQLTQSNKTDEAIHCEIGWVEVAELENSPEQMPLVSEESPNCTTTGPRKMSRSRELHEARTAFLKGKNDTATLTKEITSLNISDEHELEDEAYEIEWVFVEEVSGEWVFVEEVSGPSSKERFDQEESWGSYFYSVLVWPWSNNINEKNAE